MAWMKACATPGRPAVVVPKGDYLLHPLVFRGPCRGYMELHVAGVVRAPDGLAAFRGRSEWIHFAGIDGLLVTGGGTFDGRGATAWPLNECPRKRDCTLLPTVGTLALLLAVQWENGWSKLISHGAPFFLFWSSPSSWGASGTRPSRA
jgi:galacturan 1,4-alpha-galacturonidase